MNIIIIIVGVFGFIGIMLAALFWLTAFVAGLSDDDDHLIDD
jgi:hypothetical protein